MATETLLWPVADFPVVTDLTCFLRQSLSVGVVLVELGAPL